MSRSKKSQQPKLSPEMSPAVPNDRLTGTVSQQVDISLEALRELGLAGDEVARELLTNQYLELRASGFQGELYPQITLSEDQVSFQALLDALDGRRHPLVDPSLVGHRVWSDGYSHGELSTLGVSEDDSTLPIHGRLAVTDFSSLGSDEPLLHFRGHPFDGEASRIAVLSDPRQPSQEITVSVPTQQQMLARMQESVRIMYPGYNLAALNLPAICVILLQRRIKGENLPLQGDSHMHIPQLRRVHPVDSHDEVGQISSVRVRDGQMQLGLSRDANRMSLHGGIGLSLGRDLSE